MHVAFVVANYAPHVGGVEKHVQAVAAQLQRHGHTVTVYYLEPVGRRVHEGIPVVGIGRRWDVSEVWAFPERGAVKFLAADFRRRRVTHVSTHTRFFPATWAGLAAARRARLPTLLTEHGGGFVSVGSRLVTLAARGVDESLGRWSLRSADGLLAVSARVADFVKVLSGRRAKVCGAAIDLSLWRPHGTPEPRRRLVFAGRVVPEKGWRDFLTVMSRQPPDVTGVLAGTGAEAGRLDGEITARGMSDRVRYLGELTPWQLRQELSGAVYVNPSIAAEGFQTTLLEAAAAGAAIATYDVGGASEVVAAGASALVVTPRDVDDLAYAATRALELPRSSPERLKEYTWANVAERYEQALGALR